MYKISTNSSIKCVLWLFSVLFMHIVFSGLTRGTWPSWCVYSWPPPRAPCTWPSTHVCARGPTPAPFSTPATTSQSASHQAWSPCSGCRILSLGGAYSEWAGPILCRRGLSSVGRAYLLWAGPIMCGRNLFSVGGAYLLWAGRSFVGEA